MTRGRKAVDGAKNVTKRVNIALTPEHKEKLTRISCGDVSAWVRKAIDQHEEEGGSMTTKHTAGPWSERNGRIFQTDRQELTIANTARAFDGDYSPANARLIAAAPELLEALQAALEALRGSAGPYEISNAQTLARAAIAKATEAA